SPSRVARAHGLLIRPEALRLGHPPVGENALSAQVIGSRYRGAAVLLDLLVEGAAPVSLALPHDAPLPAAGESLTLAVQPSSCRAIPVDLA
ncbi:MAG: TOBE domain-containing protein, partial [Roseococcus sp.]